MNSVFDYNMEANNQFKYINLFYNSLMAQSIVLELLKKLNSRNHNLNYD